MYTTCSLLTSFNKLIVIDCLRFPTGQIKKQIGCN